MPIISLNPTSGNAFAIQRAKLLRNSKLTQEQANELLLTAIKNENPSAVYGALEAGADPNIEFGNDYDDTKRTLLAQIVDWTNRGSTAHLEAFRMALQCGADPYVCCHSWCGTEHSILGFIIERYYEGHGENDIRLQYASILLNEFKVNPDYAGVSEGVIYPSTSLVNHNHRTDYKYDLSNMLLLLLNAGANVEADYNGKTLLFECTEEGDPDYARHAAKLLNTALQYLPDPFRKIIYKDDNKKKTATARERAIEYGNDIAANLLCRYELVYKAWRQQGYKPAGPAQIALIEQIDPKTSPIKPNEGEVIDVEFEVKTSQVYDYFAEIVKIIDNAINKTTSGKSFSEDELRESIEPFLMRARKEGCLDEIFLKPITNKKFIPDTSLTMNILEYASCLALSKTNKPVSELGINLRRILRGWGAKTTLEDAKLKGFTGLIDDFFEDKINAIEFLVNSELNKCQEGNSFALAVLTALNAIFNKLAGSNISNSKIATRKSLDIIRNILMEATVGGPDNMDVAELIEQDLSNSGPTRKRLLKELFTYKTDMPLFEKQGGIEVNIFQYLLMLRTHSNELVSSVAARLYTIAEEYKP